MNVLTYTKFQKHWYLYTKVVVNSYQIGLFTKYASRTINYSNNYILKHRHHQVPLTYMICIQFTLSSGTYQIDDFSKKIKAAVLEQKQSRSTPHIKNIKPADNNAFHVLGMPQKIIENISIKYSLVHTKCSLLQHHLQNHQHCTANKSIKLKLSQTVNHKA